MFKRAKSEGAGENKKHFAATEKAREIMNSSLGSDLLMLLHVLDDAYDNEDEIPSEEGMEAFARELMRFIHGLDPQKAMVTIQLLLHMVIQSERGINE